MTRGFRRTATLIVAGLTSALALSACAGAAPTNTPAAPAPAESTAAAPGSAAATTPAAAPTEKTKITVGVIPIVDTAAFRLGVKKGFFADEGLEVELQEAQGGAAIVPAVLSGSNQFGFSNITSLIVAQDKNMPIRLVTSGNATTGDTSKDIGTMLVPSDSPIASNADLAGKSIAVNTLNNINDTIIRTAIEKAGGDPASPKFVEMPFPDMPAALASKNVDAAFVLEPFATTAMDQGAKPISRLYAEFDPKLIIAGYFTSDAYADANPQIVEGFTKAMKKSFEYAEANPAEARAILTEYTKIAPELVERLTMPKFPQELDMPAIQKLADQGKKFGIIASDVKAEDLTK